ncbi:uncharacterized protein SETTUDRAFT_86125 [Exserohilum turcica Et28A]|uniref:Uncharacterized protein n=1 Tax=Exserohilum turcicum (strain 28A) TaxID=671987 RepID=R0J2Q9_EXST2|nr:uncharacterized protein SETTUDRAFT_86125 [Exserohilum turcica Et28A]EOA91250.1 hypothetical protein SETTUDRAFT_86125 [Exserohilum turcica Et28A]
MQLADTVAARPVSLKLINARRTEGYTANEDRPLERLAVVLICIVLAFLLALSLGYRAGRLAGQRSKTRGSDILVFVQGFFCTAFLFIVAVLAAGLGLETKRQCFVAIRICLASYGLTKMTLYLFLFERVHIVRASFLDRRRDPIYVIGVLLTTCGFIAIASWQYTDPMAEISAQDGRCRIGPKHDSAIAIITVDTFISLILTGIFVWQLRPAVSSPLPEMPSMTSTLSKTTDAPTRGPKSWVKRVRKIIWGFNLSELQAMVLRNIVGSTIMLGCTLFNNVIFLTHDWSKVGQACMLLCLSDGQ